MRVSTRGVSRLALLFMLMAQVLWEYSSLAVLHGLHLGRSGKGLDVFFCKSDDTWKFQVILYL